MSDSTGSIANPYQGPSPEPNADAQSKRPIGTWILAVLMLLTGLWVGGDKLYQLSLVFSADEVVIHPSFYVSLTRDTLTAALAVGGAIGLIFGRGFGWWLSVLHGYWRLAIQSVLPLLGAMVSADSPSRPSIISAALTAGVLFILIILYLQKSNVLAYFRINIGRAMMNIGLLVFCVAVAFSLDVWWALTQS